MLPCTNNPASPFPMRRTALYSRGSRPAAAQSAEIQEPSPEPSGDTSRESIETPALKPRSRIGALLARWPRTVFVLCGALGAAMVAALFVGINPLPYKLTQKDIDLAVMRTLETAVLPSPATRAYAAVLPSVVRVTGYNKKEKGEEPNGVGTGVVIVDKGLILTNLHVVQGSERLKITFANGMETGASVVNTQPENDLAVLQAETVPDDLVAATMRSTDKLVPGDHVFAIGFPFGIGPSLSAGVVSGLKRNYKSPEGEQELRNLIQFDAAANPGNSGGPLVTAEGEVVGIITAILNPTEQSVFIGIGFAVPIENAAAAAGMPPF